MTDALPGAGAAGEAARMELAAGIFLEVRGLGLAQREEVIAGRCGRDPALKALVELLLRGDQAPLPVESLADDIRAAQDCATVVARGEAPGSRIGRYRLLERVGEGGFGVVFAAEQTEPVKRRVALKIIKLGMDTRQVVARFEAERQALAMMDHPSIAKVFDAGATETGRPYFVMELVRGLPITEYCDAKKLDIGARLDLFAQVCDALQHAHQKGVIHRDIKPSNVLVTEMGENAVPKVIDFGIAKATGAELTEKTIFTEMRQMIGTPEYMSPEQAGISGLDIDTRSDVYSLGVLLYELLAGVTPFDSKRLRSAAYGEVQRIIREEDPPRPSTRLTLLATRGTVAAARGADPARLGSVLKGELDWVVMKCLEKDRGRRYDSAGSLMRDVRRFMAGEAVQAVPPSAAYRVRKFVGRHRGAVVAGSLLTAAVVAGLVGTTLGFVNAERNRRAVQAEKERADAKAAEALAAEARAARSAYSANMLSACAAAEANQCSAAGSFLEAAPGSLRGWEWGVLRSRLDTSVRALACPMTDWTPGEQYEFNDMLVLPDGRSFITVRRHRMEAAQQWDSLTGRALARFARPSAEPMKPSSPSFFTVSADGTRLWGYCGVGSESPSATVVGWDLSSGREFRRTDLKPIPSVDGILCVTHDGGRVLRNHGERLFLQDVLSGEVIATGEGPLSYGMCGDSPDGSVVIVSDARGPMRVLDGRSLATRAVLVGQRNNIHGLDFSADSRFLATASIDGTARVWDLASTSPSSVTLEHPVAVERVRISPDGSLVATIGADATIRVWDVSSGRLKSLFSTARLMRGALMFMPDGRTVAGREHDGTVRFWDVTADTTVNLRHHHGLINWAGFAGNLIVSAGWDGWKGRPGSVRVCDAQTGAELAAFGEPGEVAYRLAVCRGFAAAALTKTDSTWVPHDQTGDSRLEILDLRTGRVVQIDSAKVSGTYQSLAFDPSGQLLAFSRSGRLDLIDPSTGRSLRSRTEGLDGALISRMAWSPDGSTLACIVTSAPSPNGEIVLIDPASLRTVKRLEGLTSSIAFSPDGRHLCAGAPDGTLRLFDPAGGLLQQSFQAHDQTVFALAFSPDGRRLASVCGEAGEIVVWNTAAFDRVARFRADDFVSSVAWSEDGARLAGACGDTVRIWDATPLSDRVRARDERQSLLPGIEGKVAAWHAESQDWPAVLARIGAERWASEAERVIAEQTVFRLSLAESLAKSR